MQNAETFFNVPDWSLKAIFQNNFDGLSDQQVQAVKLFMDKTKLSSDTTRIWYECGEMESGLVHKELLQCTPADEMTFSCIGAMIINVEIKDNNENL